LNKAYCGFMGDPMTKSVANRLSKLESKLLPPPLPPVWVRTFADQHGTQGETIRIETDEQAIQRHLEENPEDAGREFNIIVWVAVTPEHEGLYDSEAEAELSAKSVFHGENPS
jgi:hypothetical protein